MSDLVEKKVPYLDHAGLGDDHEGQRRHLPAARLRVLTPWVVHWVWGWSATPSWGRPTPRPGARPAGSSTCRCAPTWRCSAGGTRPRSPPRPRSWAGGRSETDWKQLLARDDVALVDVCTPGDTHAEIAIAALDAGKHVLCEKPLANTVAEARAMVAAAERARAAGVRSMVGFNYRRVPAVALARQLVAEGRIGQVRHVRAQYLQDWIVDPEFPLVWRLQADKAGSGALGDIGAHIVDMAQFVIGDRLTGVSALTETFVQGAAAGRGVERAGRHRRRRNAGRSPSTTRRCSSAGSAGARWRVRGHPVRHRPQERAAARGQRQRGIAGVRLRVDERAVVLRRHRGPRDGGLPPHPGHRADPPVRRGVVAAGARAGLRALVHPRGRGPGHRPGRGPGPDPSFADGLQVQLVLDAVRAVRRGRAAGGSDIDAHSRRRADGATDHAVHRPVGRPALRGGGPAGRGVGLRRAGDRLLGRPLRPVGGGRGRRLRRRAAARSWPSTACRSSRSPTTSPARRSATTRSTSGTRASCRRGCGATASPRACGSAPPRPCR